MSFESSGAEYLRRLKHDQQPFAEPAPVSSSSDPGGPEPGGPTERRSNPRYKCEGSAAFRAPGSDVRTWGTFTDLSVGGCYVELKATFPAGAMIDLELELNGVRAQLKGEVRVSYPFLGMGVAFRDMTPENRRQVQAMIDSLSPAIPRVHPIEPENPGHAGSLPIIVNAGAALQVLADFFEVHGQLTREEFIRLLRKSQGL